MYDYRQHRKQPGRARLRQSVETCKRKARYDKGLREGEKWACYYRFEVVFEDKSSIFGGSLISRALNNCFCSGFNIVG